MLDAPPKQDLSEQPIPPPASSPVGVAPADDCEEDVSATEEESDYALLQQLSASAIQSCRGTDLAEPRCFLHVLGFKSPAMETTYLAYHSRTALTGHRLFAAVNLSYFVIRIWFVLSGQNYLEFSLLTVYFLCTLGLVAVLSSCCGFYFSGREVEHLNSLGYANTFVAALAFSGWFAQYVDIFHFQTGWEQDNVDVFNTAYFGGALGSMGPAFCLVMLRVPFHWYLSLAKSLLTCAASPAPSWLATYSRLRAMQKQVVSSCWCGRRLTVWLHPAFQAINHCAKRVMYNTVQACSDIKRDTIPKLLAKPDDVVLVQQLAEIIECVEKDCQEGFGKCRDAIALKQLYSGEYQPVHEPISIRSLLTDSWGQLPKLVIVVDELVPEWLSLCVPLFMIIMQNAIHNAKIHGERNGVIHLNLKLVQVGLNQLLQVHLQNKPGKNHDAAVQMQSELLSSQSKDSLGKMPGKIGNAMSTFLGMAEIQTAAAAMSATTNLSFHPNTEAEAGCVVFMLQVPLVAATDPGDVDSSVPLKLRAGTFMICADDDKIARMMYKSLAKKCGATEFTVLGETFNEAASLVSVVKTAAALHGEANVVILLDQNMDNYKEGKIFGTDVTTELRSDGFKGIIIIRSANDDAASANKYRRAGANGCVGKTPKSAALVRDIVKQCNLAWEMEMVT